MIHVLAAMHIFALQVPRYFHRKGDGQLAKHLADEREAWNTLNEVVDNIIWYPANENSAYPVEPITFLDLGGSDISDDSLECLKHFELLEHLCLDGTSITDAGLAHLSILKGLKTLDLQDTDVTDAGIQALKQELPGCEIIC